jgi:hypothetical protein
MMLYTAREVIAAIRADESLGLLPPNQLSLLSLNHA